MSDAALRPAGPYAAAHANTATCRTCSGRHHGHWVSNASRRLRIPRTPFSRTSSRKSFSNCFLARSRSQVFRDDASRIGHRRVSPVGRLSPFRKVVRSVLYLQPPFPSPPPSAKSPDDNASRRAQFVGQPRCRVGKGLEAFQVIRKALSFELGPIGLFVAIPAARNKRRQYAYKTRTASRLFCCCDPVLRFVQRRASRVGERVTDENSRSRVDTVDDIEKR